MRSRPGWKRWSDPPDLRDVDPSASRTSRVVVVTSAPAANSTSLSVAERMARLLGVVPWVVEQDGAHLDDISARFDYPREQLLEDLEQRLFFVGVHPFTPDTLIEVRISDGIVDIQYADWFSQPMRLSPEEATRLLAAGRSVLDMTKGSGRGTVGRRGRGRPTGAGAGEAESVAGLGGSGQRRLHRGESGQRPVPYPPRLEARRQRAAADRDRVLLPGARTR